MKIILAVLLVATSVSADSTLVMSSYQANWFEAQTNCRSRGMHLATVDSQAKQYQVENLMYNSGLCVRACAMWIGANDLASEGSFVWEETGNWISYSNWNRINPSNSHGDEDCVEVLYSPKNLRDWSYKWNDRTCTGQKRHFICERKIVPSTTTTTVRSTTTASSTTTVSSFPVDIRLATPE